MKKASTVTNRFRLVLTLELPCIKQVGIKKVTALSLGTTLSSKLVGYLPQYPKDRLLAFSSLIVTDTRSSGSLRHTGHISGNFILDIFEMISSGVIIITPSCRFYSGGITIICTLVWGCSSPLAVASKVSKVI